MRKFAPVVIFVAAFVAGLFLTGCASWVQTAKMADKAAEPIVDVAVDAAENLRCRRPLDIVGRTIDRHGREWGQGWMLSCPEQRALMERLLQTIPDQVSE